MDRALSTLLGPRLRKDWREGVERLVVLPRRSLKAVGMALLALLAGTGKAAMDFDEDLAGAWDLWTSGLVISAAAMWLLWLVTSACEFFGSEIFSVERGGLRARTAAGGAAQELIVSRGIGPLRRTFRYRVREISELVTPFAEEEAKPRVHNIYVRPKAGAVRFDYGRKTVHFAETLDEADGEAVVAWLRRKLPRSAGEVAMGLGYAG